MRCSDLGERALINLLPGILGPREEEDCALIDMGRFFLAVSTDMLHQETDFPSIMTPWQMGWMTAAVNLSDLAAMGAWPLGLLVAAGIPEDTDIEDFQEIFTGLRDCARAYGTEILGGDMDEHRELTFTGTALGCVEKDKVLRRRGAQVGDLLCTTGSLGGAGAGLRVLEEMGGHPPERLESLVRCLLEPKPRMMEGRSLALSGAVTSMMDISDGLAISVSDLSRASGVGFLVEERSLPMASGLEAFSPQEQRDLALYQGGDFELLFTLEPERVEEVRGKGEGRVEFTVIGRVVEKGLWLEVDGDLRPLVVKGYQHMIPDDPG